MSLRDSVNSREIHKATRLSSGPRIPKYIFHLITHVVTQAKKRLKNFSAAQYLMQATNAGSLTRIGPPFAAWLIGWLLVLDFFRTLWSRPKVSGLLRNSPAKAKAKHVKKRPDTRNSW
jgi:hypothetical protein